MVVQGKVDGRHDDFICYAYRPLLLCQVSFPMRHDIVLALFCTVSQDGNKLLRCKMGLVEPGEGARAEVLLHRTSLQDAPRLPFEQGKVMRQRKRFLIMPIVPQMQG